MGGRTEREREKEREGERGEEGVWLTNARVREDRGVARGGKDRGGSSTRGSSREYQ